MTTSVVGLCNIEVIGRWMAQEYSFSKDAVRYIITNMLSASKAVVNLGVNVILDRSKSAMNSSRGR